MRTADIVKQYKVPIILILGLIAGTIYVNLSVKYFNMSPQMFSCEFFAVYEEVEVNAFFLWQYVFTTRFRDFIAIGIFCFTNLRKIVVNIYIAYFGALSGAMISFAVMNYGVVGVWIYLLSVLPQYILYIVAYRVVYSIGMGGCTQSTNDVKKYIFMVLFIVSLVFAGTYVEAYVNPLIMRWMYSLLWF